MKKRIGHETKPPSELSQVPALAEMPQRFTCSEFESMDSGRCTMDEDQAGEYVEYEEYKSLRAYAQSLQKRVMEVEADNVRLCRLLEDRANG